MTVSDEQLPPRASAPLAEPPHAPLARPFWTNLILAVNTLVFLGISLASGDFFSPDPEYLQAFGAKDVSLLASGQWWRFLTPMFLHIGVLHFVLNSLALKYVGRYLEVLIGGRWFLVIYLLTGIVGNVASSLSNVQMGAGASGAIFGLIGVGVVFEWLLAYRAGELTSAAAYQAGPREGGGLGSLRRRLIPGPFTSMALLNIGLAIAINTVMAFSEGASIGIDNAAHLGGLAAGMVLAVALLALRPNALMQQRRYVAIINIGLVVAVIATGGYVVMKTDYISGQFRETAASYDDPPHQLFYLEQGLRLNPRDAQLRLARGRVLLLAGHPGPAYADFAYVLPRHEYSAAWTSLAAELREQGRQREAHLLLDYAGQVAPTPNEPTPESAP